VKPPSIRSFLGLLASFQSPSWKAARCVLAMVRGEAPEDLELSRRLTGRILLPTAAARALVWIAGRGAGKSRGIAALVAFFAAALRYTRAPGERIYAVVVSPTRAQSRVTFGYLVGLFQSRQELTALVDNVTADEIQLKNGVSIIVAIPDFRTIRGRAICIAAIEETAFLPADESATPDKELVRAIMPALGRVPDSLLVLVSSPWARKGVLFEQWRKHWGIDGDPTLVVRGSTADFNPQFDQTVIEAAYADDPVSAATEYGAEWRSDAESLLTEEAIARCVASGRGDLPSRPNQPYAAFLDFAGGSGADSATLAIAHAEEDAIIVDAVRERRPPFSPEDCCREFADLCRTYDVSSAIADKWGGQFPVEQMAKLGITVTPSEKTKSELYKDFVPIVNSGRIQLPDQARLLAQLGTLERRASGGGRESIDHGPGQHDDLANAVAGVAMVATAGAGMSQAEREQVYALMLDRDEDDEDAALARADRDVGEITGLLEWPRF
jgi:hypothetical protein